MGVGIGPDHPGIAIPEQVVVDGARAQRVHGAGELVGPDLGEPRTRLVGVERRIVDLALRPVGAGHEVDADALGHQARDRAAGAHRLVVGMGVDEEDAAGCLSLHEPSPRCWSEPRW